ncbi:DegT/DnrJ/EryC1/StrS family aminotransferase [Rhodomicrobium sp. Az07]|uniref:DegT/DnrJ/EryC1/StrS family aminotransferase n=1 Tax=Rhodomicrobium sp. Az07 TaxID=2839034 RepID=UPI001BE85736|nr:DegT/DnrJ/EryC1/StrS family aminotransferase [Rhodomicrobium sp. Az07]MBT3069773.1 DegT/DnrJ/EryC1/StrS family aminotransferase [Rhodomicrobium sp. Az07]
MDFIPVNEPLLDGNEKAYLNQCIETGWISSEGPFVREFEDKFAARCGRKHGIAVANGTAALDAAVEALGIGPGDEVILPAFTIISCIAQIVRSGAKPVLVDADPITWNMDVSQIESRITQHTKAIMVVHTYGLPVDMDPVLALARRHNLRVIEDAAEAHGQTYRGKPCGSFGDLSVFSFYPNKHVTTGEGGMILTDDDELAEICRSLRNLCFQPHARFVHERLGWNLRMTNLQAAIGLAQLERLDGFVARKRSMGRLYTELLADIRGIQLPLDATDYADNIYWVFGLVIETSRQLSAAAAMKALAQKRVGTRPFFWPMHEQPVFSRMGLFAKDDHPTASRIARQGFYIPSGLALTPSQAAEVAERVRAVFNA